MVRFTPLKIISTENVQLTTKQGNTWAPQPVWTLWKKEKFLAPSRNRNTVPQLPSMWSSEYTDWVVLPAVNNIRLNKSERHTWVVSSYGRLNRGLVQYLPSEPGCLHTWYVTLHLHFIYSSYTALSLFYFGRKLHVCYSAAAVNSEINDILWWYVNCYGVSTTMSVRTYPLPFYPSQLVTAAYVVRNETIFYYIK